MAGCGCGPKFVGPATSATSLTTGCTVERGCLDSDHATDFAVLDALLGCPTGGCGTNATTCCGEVKTCRQAVTTSAISGQSCPLAPTKISQNYVIVLEAPRFVTPQPASLNEVTLALDDSALEYRVIKVQLSGPTRTESKCEDSHRKNKSGGGKWSTSSTASPDMSLGGGETKAGASSKTCATFGYEVRLVGKLHFQLQYNAFVSSPTIESAYSNWPLTRSGSLPVDKYIVTLSSRPTNICRTGFRGKLAEYLDPVGSSVSVDCQTVKVRIQTNFTAYADWYRQVSICGIGVCNCIVTGDQPWHVDIIDAQGNLVQSLTSNTQLEIPGQWTTSSPIDAGVYTIKYICNNINFNTNTMKELYCFTDFFHLDNTKTQATNLACQTC